VYRQSSGAKAMSRTWNIAVVTLLAALWSALAFAAQRARTAEHSQVEHAIVNVEPIEDNSR
jgi:hypothetical protein